MLVLNLLLPGLFAGLLIPLNYVSKIGWFRRVTALFCVLSWSDFIWGEELRTLALSVVGDAVALLSPPKN